MTSLPSRSSSWSSVSSTSSTLSPVQSRHDPYELETRATEILTSLANHPQHAGKVIKHISPNIKVEHGDDSPVYSLQKYLTRFSDASARCPHLCLNIMEACVDEVQRKVWVRSEITGLPGGLIKERIDQLYFDEQGILIGSIDHQKIKKRW